MFMDHSSDVSDLRLQELPTILKIAAVAGFFAREAQDLVHRSVEEAAENCVAAVARTSYSGPPLEQLRWGLRRWTLARSIMVLSANLPSMRRACNVAVGVVGATPPGSARVSAAARARKAAANEAMLDGRSAPTTGWGTADMANARPAGRRASRASASHRAS